MNGEIGHPQQAVIDEVTLEKAIEERRGRDEATILSLSNLSRIFLILLLVAALAMAFSVVLPFLNSIIFAAVLAILFYPVHQWLLRKFGKRKNLTSLVSLLIITFCIILPMIIFVTSIVAQGIQVTADIRAWFESGGVQDLQNSPTLNRWLETLQYRLGFNLQNINLRDQALEASKRTSEFLISQSASIIGNISSFFVSFSIMLFILFYLLRDGPKYLKEIKHLSPLRERQENLIFAKIKGVTYSVLIGSLLTALLQGIVGGIGMAIVGIPALFWGTMLAFSSLVPIVGTALIWVPSVGYLLITGQYTNAFIFFLWSSLFVSSIDNFVRPLLMKGHGGMSTLTLFMAIVGGIQFFGVSGLLYGPLVFGFALVMLSLYRHEYCVDMDERECARPLEQE